MLLGSFCLGNNSQCVSESYFYYVMSFSRLARIRGFILTLYFKTFSLFHECLDPSNSSSKDLSGDIIFLQMIRLMYLCGGGGAC